MDVIQEASDEVLDMLYEEKVGRTLRKAIYPLHLTHEQRHMLDSTFQNIRTSIREYIESRESSEGRTGMRSQER